MKNKKSIIVIIILSILLIASIGLICYQNINYQDLNEKYKNVNKSLSKAKSDLEKTNPTEDKSFSSEENYTVVKDSENNKSYKLYDTSGIVSVIGYNNKIYYIESFDSKDDDCLEKFLYEKDGKVNFKDGKYECIADNDETMPSYVYETKISEDDIYKVVISKRPNTSDGSYLVFFILKNGHVKVSGIGIDGISSISKLDKYEIKDIKNYYCSSGIRQSCKRPMKMDIVLKDNTKKTITLTDSDLNIFSEY